MKISQKSLKLDNSEKFGNNLDSKVLRSFPIWIKIKKKEKNIVKFKLEKSRIRRKFGQESTESFPIWVKLRESENMKGTVSK